MGKNRGKENVPKEGQQGPWQAEIRVGYLRASVGLRACSRLLSPSTLCPQALPVPFAVLSRTSRIAPLPHLALGSGVWDEKDLRGVHWEV